MTSNSRGVVVQVRQCFRLPAGVPWLTSFALVAAAATALFAQAPTISTGPYNNNRTGANLAEVLLNTTNVNVTQFGKVASLPLDGREYGNPLFIPNVTFPVAGGGTYTTNALYIATQKNTIFAFDANT